LVEKISLFSAVVVDVDVGRFRCDGGDGWMEEMRRDRNRRGRMIERCIEVDQEIEIEKEMWMLLLASMV